ncbi:hypothetical protein MCOR27_004004 [Pyricularia oryzae]|uniref:Nineteen complex-related protein 2-domain-containing protein n=2 Tax=Pyricularia TaxID=48558 RepID=A0ABQ8P183_PYRGI|nr:hypothetical protein MCOR01_011382 [Pyricularia oryzae]KAI6305072.1 hypothetical protein MCOR33_000189 [Pyricularia grisea]KAI6256071.1 hypothetical protein MCOR19_007440 [Pyricularia oryzae]KAI6281904.1 hypothetical protein MCOR27_004004 [Pyricularia oryzae]KAI6314961.1 hypothetical protein MCOR30_009814 [Pyricularia oryzae]
MSNLFSTKRKPRAVRTFGGDDDDDDAPKTVESSTSEPVKEANTSTAPLKFGKRPFKQSALRRSINVHEASEGDDSSIAPAPPPDSKPKPTSAAADDDDGPVVVRPALSRTGSTKTKKKRLSSRLSFGGDAAEADDGDAALDTAFGTPKKTSLSARAFENSALRSRLPIGGSGSRPSLGGDDDGPRYSKEFLDELANSTPNTPRNISSLRIHDGDGPLAYDEAMELDMAELDGAVIVSEPGQVTRHKPESTPSILTETQIRERKERRARLAAEQEFMPLEGSDEEEAEYISLGSRRKKEKESRLVREDEDLGEGFDEYVEDGGLSLGRRAEREAAKKRRAEMAELINLAEDDGADGLAGDLNDDDDSEAERRAAYEEAQTRAGMDGLNQQQKHSTRVGTAGEVFEIPRMKPLPDLAGCLAQMQSVLLGMQGDVAAKKAQVARLEMEKEEIVTREAEVQAILDKAGKDYQAKTGVSSAEIIQGSAVNSPLRPVPPAERGLESFGTPTSNRIDVDMDDGATGQV